MMNSNEIVPPHLNAEVYRSNTSGTDTVSFIDYIQQWTDGSFLMGKSELTGRYWNGNINVFESVLETQDKKSDIKKGISLQSGTCDGCFLEASTSVLVCEDNGSVSVWTYNTDDAWKEWIQEITVAEHDDAVLAVDCLIPSQKYVTVGADGIAKVWDINDLICVRNYKDAHDMPIYGVAVRPNSVSTFATGSADMYTSLWDENTFKPTLNFPTNDSGVRCLKWLDENSLLIGDEAGMLKLVDIRQPTQLQYLTEFPAAVHKMAIHTGTRNIALCCDNKTVTVCTVSGDKCKVIYSNKTLHSNYVRGLTWDVNQDNLLHSGGWDGEIRTHSIRDNENEN